MVTVDTLTSPDERFELDLTRHQDGELSVTIIYGGIL
jgi:hypothetical protein